MLNKQIADIFNKIAEMLEIKGENVFRIRAYRRAAQSVESLSSDISELVKEDKLRGIPGIGEDLENKIKEFISTGKIKLYDELANSLPFGLIDLLAIPGVGPRTAKLFCEKLKIKGIADLEKAIEMKRLEKLEGIKEKTIANIVEGIKLVKLQKERMTLPQAIEVADYFISSLKKVKSIDNICVAGSLRRCKETVRDVDILVISSDSATVMRNFVNLAEVKRVLVHGQTKSSVLTKNDIQVDLRILPRRSFGSALIYFTGSQQFNIKLRQIAQKNNLKVNEYGVFRSDKFIAGKTEKEVFRLLGMSYIAPELREDRGEIELSFKNRLPELIEEADIKGDLHVHSVWSDGINEIADIAKAAQARGYEYVAITDHSQSLKIANGLTVRELIKKKKEIDKINSKIKNFRVLFGTEVEIDSAGRIDYPEKILKSFDIVIGAIHSGFKQTRNQLTNRIVNACKNKYVNIIAHPTGRLFGTRDSYEIDFDKIFRIARDNNTFMEINSFPNRLDFCDINARLAKTYGLKMAINTDSHAVHNLGVIKFGISMARRGWLEKRDVINTLSLEGLLKEIRK